MELRHKSREIGGFDLHWVEVGTGAPLLLIHGFAVSHREWLDVLPELSRSFHCIVPDLIGAGASSKPSPSEYPYTREGLAGTLALLVKELGLDSVDVCGHSMGGGIALTLAADHPDLVRRLCVIDSVCFPFRMPFKGRIPVIPVVGEFIFKRLYGRKMFHQYFRDEVFNGRAMNTARVDEYYNDFDTREGRAAAHATLVRAVHDLETLPPKIPRIEAPTLLVWAEQDRLFPVSLGHRLAREMRNAKLHIIDGSGHAPNEEQPARVVELVTSHFQASA